MTTPELHDGTLHVPTLPSGVRYYDVNHMLEPKFRAEWFVDAPRWFFCTRHDEQDGWDDLTEAAEVSRECWDFLRKWARERRATK